MSQSEKNNQENKKGRFGKIHEYNRKRYYRPSMNRLQNTKETKFREMRQYITTQYQRKNG